MAAKRNKSQAKRNGGGGRMPGWAWLLLGVGLTVGVAVVALKFLDFDGERGFFRADDVRPPAVDAIDESDEPIVTEDDPPATDAGKEPEYDFFTLLPGEETPVSDAELAASARAEEARRQQDAAEIAAPDETTADDATPPKAIDAAPPGDASADTRDDTPTRPDSQTRPAASDQTASAREARYLLQAGAFAASGDAEALKAKIAFLGLGARVESAQIKGKTVYRVRMGPYGSATELAEAKRKLGDGGLQAMAIKVK
ncbi:MAG: sporulation protein [Lysobacteraceae bacterium]|nr:MAG: sporulation protein [Xanthomonadaceae bacterium]